MNFVRARRTAGLSLMLSSLVVGILATPAATAAENEVPENLEGVDIERQAYWNADHAKYSDNAATSEFPPQSICLVAPDACFFPEGEEDPSSPLPTGQLDPFAEEGEETEDGLGPLANSTSSEAEQQEQELLATMAENDDGTEPADPVPPGSHPVSVAFGQQNYRAAIDFELPELADGDQVDEFLVVLTQGDPTYANESPAFRQAVLAALTCAQENDESPFGRCTPSEFEKVDPEDLQDGSPLSIEACPIIGDWEAGPSQDEDELPEVDCLYTALGTPVAGEDDEILWVFDMYFAARAWYDGTLEANGVLFRPGSAENFAYGDPETTYSKQVTFEQPVQVAMATSAEPEPFTSGNEGSGTSGSANSGSGSFTGGSGPSDVFATPQQSGSFGTPGGSSMPLQPTEQPPNVSEPVQTPAPSQAEGPQTLAAGTPLGTPEMPWWIWLLVPIFLAGAWLLSRALAEEAVLASQRSGAMTRLLERQAAADTSRLVTA